MLCDVRIAPVRTLQENLQEWLMDPRGRDQFVVRHGDETEVCPKALPSECGHSDRNLQWAGHSAGSNLLPTYSPGSMLSSC
jgi:hypothetical protein